MKTCKENAPGCLKTFEPKRDWQKTCGNLQCKIQRAKRKTKEWADKHSKHLKKYQKEYRML